jgi:hypothetical protein
MNFSERSGAGTQTTDQETNGHAEPDIAAQQERIRRAEEAVDRMAERLSRWFSTAGREVLRLGERIREEAEDMWAEASEVRESLRAPHTHDHNSGGEAPSPSRD